MAQKAPTVLNYLNGLKGLNDLNGDDYAIGIE
jgi:hypothetical protein